MSRKTLIFSGSTIIITILIAILYLPQTLKSRQQSNPIHMPTAQPLPTLTPTPTPERKSALEIAWDKQRQTDILNIVNAVYLYAIEKTRLPEDFPTTPTCVGKAKTCYDLEFLEPNYINQIPEDPQTGDVENTGYYVFLDDGRLTASASGGITVRK
jgi:hypothetical protein